MKSPLHLLWQIPALTVSLFICFVIAGMLSGLTEAPPSSETGDPAQAEAMAEAAQTAALLLLSCFLTAAILGTWLCFVKWRGWKLILIVFTVYFIANTVLTQVESLFFNAALELPASMLWKIILSGLIISILFAPISVGIMGRMRSSKQADSSLEVNSSLLKSLCWIAASYVLIYFLFGYFIAWQSEAVREYYSGSTAILPFHIHMWDVLTGNPGLILFQFIRGLVWGGLAVLIARSMSVSWGTKAIITGLIFGVMLAGGLLIPNPFMPESVRWAHLWETSSSNFVLGILCIYILEGPAWAKKPILAQTD